MTRRDEENVMDSPTDWVAEHIRRYVETDGAEGHMFQGIAALLLTTRGRRSGARRRTALFYGKDGDRYVVVASNGGSPRHPAWYLNLVEHPEVEVQVGPERFAARARAATAEERPSLWRQMAAVFPQYDTFQAATAREIPLVIVERA
jgi:deazaflavin-dependent oxidoreductase (nitroreductase family)